MVTEIAPDAVPIHNNFGSLATDDASLVESGVPPSDNPHGHDDVNGHPSHNNVDALTQRNDDLFRTTDAMLTTINDFNLAEERLKTHIKRELTQTIATKLALTKESLKKSFGDSVSSFLANIRRDVDNSKLALTRDIQRMDDQITQMSDCLQQNNSSFTVAIQTILMNTATLAQETSALSVQVVEHQSHLDNLLGFEEAWRQQMDDHVKQRSDLSALITEVRSNTTIQTQSILAQLDGLRSTMDSHNTTTKADLIDIRGRIVPDLHEHATAIASNVNRLEDRFGDFDATNLRLSVDCLEERLDALRAEFNKYTENPIRVSVPLIKVDDRVNVPPIEVDDMMPTATNIGSGRFVNINPTFQSTSSWYARDSPRHDELLAEVQVCAPITSPHYLLTTTRYHSWGAHCFPTVFQDSLTCFFLGTLL